MSEVSYPNSTKAFTIVRSQLSNFLLSFFKVCTERAKQRNDQMHKKVHTCDLCGLTFKHAGALTYHKKDKHGSENLENCPC